MKEDINDIVSIVEDINEGLYKQLGNETLLVCTVEIVPLAGYIGVKFLDQMVWHNEDDNRDYIPAPGCEDMSRSDKEYDENKEPLEGYLRKEIMKIVNQISKIEL